MHYFSVYCNIQPRFFSQQTTRILYRNWFKGAMQPPPWEIRFCCALIWLRWHQNCVCNIEKPQKWQLSCKALTCSHGLAAPHSPELLPRWEMGPTGTVPGMEWLITATAIRPQRTPCLLTRQLLPRSSEAPASEVEVEALLGGISQNRTQAPQGKQQKGQRFKNKKIKRRPNHLHGYCPS